MDKSLVEPRIVHLWAPDSQHVAVSFRSSRHISELNLYTVDGGRTKPVAGPSLFHQVTSGDLAESDDLPKLR